MNPPEWWNPRLAAALLVLGALALTVWLIVVLDKILGP